MAVLEIIDDDGHVELRAPARRIRTTSPDSADDDPDSAADVLAPPPRIRSSRLQGDDIRRPTRSAASPARRRISLIDSDDDCLPSSRIAPHLDPASTLRRAVDLAPPRRSRSTSVDEVDHPDSTADVPAPRLQDDGFHRRPRSAAPPARSRIPLMEMDSDDAGSRPAARIAPPLEADSRPAAPIAPPLEADSRPAARVAPPPDAASTLRRAAALRRTADLVGAFLFLPPQLRRRPRHFEADEPESSARPATSRTYACFYDLDLPLLGGDPLPLWWRTRALEVFTVPDPTRSTHELVPTPTPPQALVDVPQLPAPPSRGRAARGRPRGRSTPPPVARPSPPLALGTGPGQGEHVEDYIFRRWWEVAVELEELMNRYELIKEFENTPYTKKATAERLWETFRRRLKICRSARREIKRLGGEPPCIPENLVDEYFGISCPGSWV